jgi:hypothetical protein
VRLGAELVAGDTDVGAQAVVDLAEEHRGFPSAERLSRSSCEHERDISTREGVGRQSSGDDAEPGHDERDDDGADRP